MAIVPKTEPIVYPSSETEIPHAPRRSIDILHGVMIGGCVIFFLIILSFFVPRLLPYGDGVMILLALACGALLLPLTPAHRKDDTTERIYILRIGPFIWRLYGDEQTDTWFDENKKV